jgi:hypothetical protein
MSDYLRVRASTVGSQWTAIGAVMSDPAYDVREGSESVHQSVR